jgi:two-component system, NarL family, nitrate/nitrite response regulator NarL
MPVAKTRDSRDLTPRERDVLECVADGCSNAELARRLGVTYDTAKIYVKRLRAKLGLKSRTAMAVWGDRTLNKEKPCQSP